MRESGIPVLDLCRKHGVIDSHIYKWKAKYSGTDVSEAKRLWTLEDESGKLKRMLADASGLSEHEPGACAEYIALGARVAQ